MHANPPPRSDLPTSSAASTPSRGRVLVALRDALLAASTAQVCTNDGYEVSVARNAEQALERMARSDTDVALIDLALTDPGPSTGDHDSRSSLGSAGQGIDLLRRVRREQPDVALIAVTEYGTVESAVESLRVGACDYLVKPLVEAELRLSLERAMRERTLRSENRALRGRAGGRGANADAGALRDQLPSVAGSDPRMRRVYELVHAVAPSKSTVLMTGESGTGKSLIARAIHDHSPRAGKPFVEISCGSIPETLLESELFGYVKGAFTGAHADKIGRFLAASGGTLFLDEINSATPAMQLKLLRVLQERRFEPVGSSSTVEVDVRVILATNQPLEPLVASGAFRQDLYYRINVFAIALPPLRERASDVAELAHLFLARFAGELRRQVVGFTPEAMDALRAYAFPGNVRELQNIIERASVLTQGQLVGVEHLPEHVARPILPDLASRPALRIADAAGHGTNAPDAPWTPMTLEEALREPERDIIVRALKANAWNRQKTSDQLGINRTTLYKKMKALGLLDGEHADRLAG